MFEALEPRMLLSADLPGAGVPELLRTTTASPEPGPVEVMLQAGPQSVSPGIVTPPEWQGTPERVWTIHGDVTGDLAGGTNDRDTFILGPDASVSGIIDGGAGGFDSLVIAERQVGIVIFNATGPDSGTVQLDGQTVAYRGMEPLPDETVAPEKVFNLATNGVDTFRITDAPTAGRILIDSLNGTFEDHTVREPTQTFTFNAGGGNDVITLDAVLFSSDFIIDGGGGTDTVDVSGRAVGMTAIRRSDGTVLLVDGAGSRVELRNVETVTGADFTLTANGIPDWIEQGPGGVDNAAGFPRFRGQPWAGAIQAVADHPFNANVLFAGAVNGGVWRSLDGGATWSTTTDQFPSLAIGALAVSTHDNAGNLVTAATPPANLVVYAGTGQFSNFYTGGQNVGLMRSTNGGATWDLVTPTDMAGLAISSIVATRIGGQDVVVVGTIANAVSERDASGDVTSRIARAGGVFRSTDGGATFTKTEIVPAPATPSGYSFPVSSVTSIVQDPANLSRLYAGVIGGGVYQSDNGGQTWNVINANLGAAADGVDNDAEGGVDNPEEGPAGAARIVLTVRNDAASGANPVYAALVGKTDWLLGIWSKAPADANWNLVGTSPAPRNPLYAEDVVMNFVAASATQTVNINAGAIPTIVRNDGGSFLTEGFLPGRVISLVGGGNNAFYHVRSVTPSTLTLDAQSNVTAAAGLAGVSIRQVSQTQAEITGNPTLTIAAGGAPGVITVTRPAGAGTWGADGLMAGHLVRMTGTVNNNGAYFVTAATPTVLTLRLITTPPAAFVAEPAPASGITLRGEIAIPSTPSAAQPQVHVGNQGTRNFGMAVDAAGNVFIGGDTARLSTNLFWWDNRAAPNGQVWRAFQPTGTHPDTRVFTFDANGRLLQSDDGGLYRLPNPAATPPVNVSGPFTFANGAQATITRTPASGSFVTDGFQAGMRLSIRNASGPNTLGNLTWGQFTIQTVTAQTLTLSAGDVLPGALIGTFTTTLEASAWTVLNQGIRAIEFLAVAYDPLNNVVFGGTQDNGVTEQPSPNNGIDDDGDGVTDEADERFDWNEVVVFRRPGDGNTAAAVPVNTDADAAFEQVRRYTMSNGVDTLGTRLFDANGQMIAGSDHLVGLSASAADRVTFTANPVNGVLTGTAAHTLANGDVVWIDSTGNFPTGIAGFRSYFVINVNGAGANTFQLSTTAGGAALAFTDAGTGTLTATRRFTGLSGNDPGRVSDFNKWPFTVNTVDPSRMVLGMGRLYESRNLGTAAVPVYDGLETIQRVPTPVAGTGNGQFYSAIVAGGVKNGTANADFLVAARGNEVLIRTASTGVAGDFVQERIGHVNEIRDLAVDPADHDIIYAATDDGVWRRNAANDWVSISQTMVNPDLRSLEITRMNGHLVVLAGGAAGVYRAIDPAAGGTWTEFGNGLPNALVFDLDLTERDAAQFDNPRSLARDDVLLAGTQGRGAWTVGSADAFLSTPAVLRIDGGAGDDEFVIKRSETNASLVEVRVGLLGDLVYTASIDTLQKIEVFGGGGNDTLTIDSTNGALTLRDGISFDGGDGAGDRIVFEGRGVESKTSTVNGARTTLKVFDARFAGVQNVTYESVTAGNVVDNLQAATDGEKFGFGLDYLFNYLDASAEGSWDELALVGNSLPRALQGRGTSGSAPNSDGSAAPGDPTAGSALTDAVLAGFRRLVEEGPNGFAVGSIATMTAAQLREKLDALDTTAGNVTLTSAAGDTRFDATIVRRIEGQADLDILTSQLGGVIDLGGDLRIGAEITLRVVFGIDADGFYIDTTSGNTRLTVRDIDVAGDLQAGGRIGFIDVTLADAALTVDPSLRVDLVLKDAGGDNRLRVADLQAAVDSPSVLDGTLDFVVAGSATDDVSLTVDARVAAVLPGDDAPFDLGAANVTFNWADIKSPSTVSLSAAAGPAQTLLDFLRVDAQQVLDQIRSLAEFSVTFEGKEVPLLADTLDQIVAVADYIQRNILDPISTASGQVRFGSIQELVSNLADELGISPSALGLEFNGATKELTWDLSFTEQLFSANALDLGFDLDAGLADLSFSSDASISGQFNFDVTVGIDFDDLLATPADPGAWMFIRDPQASAELILAAENLDASARFGFLGVDVVDGSITANPTFTLSLAEPAGGNGNGRIDFDELVDSLGTAALSFSGSGTVVLPISAPFIGLAANPADAITLDWSDLSDTSTIAVGIPTALTDLSRFNNMDAGTFVSLLAQITGWLSDLKNTEAFSVDIPLVGDAVRGALELGDLVQKALMYDDNGTEDTLEDDTAKLVDKDNNPTFTTAQGLANALKAILGLEDSETIRYDAASESLIVDLLLQRTFAKVDVPLDFNIDLGDIADITGDGDLELTADGELGIRLGVYLGDEGYVSLSNGTTLASLKGGAITFNKDRVIAAPDDVRLSYGQLSADAQFRVRVGDATEDVLVTVAQSATTSNQTIDDLMADVSAALAAAGLAGQIGVGQGALRNEETGAVTLENRLVLIGQGGVTNFTYRSANSAASQLGFGNNQSSETVDGQTRIRATNVLVGRPGRLSADATFNVALDGVNNGSPVAVTVARSETTQNMSILDVVADVQKAIDDAEVGGVRVFKDKVVVSSEGRRLIFSSKVPGAASFDITAAAGSVAVTELGLATTNSASTADIIITTRDGVKRNVSFDALDSDATLGDVIAAIEGHTGGRVQVEFTDNDSRLRLRDTTGSGNTVFRVENAIGSNAASLLGILGSDVVDPDDPDEVRDFIIDSAPLGGIDTLDRLFIENAHARAGFNIETPGDGVELGARFGFVGVSLTGDGQIQGDITMALQDPGTSRADGRITLKELLGGLSDLDTLIDAPVVDGSGQLEFAVDLNPSFGLIQTGNEPKVTIAITDIGDPFASQAPQVTVTTSGFDELGQFDDIGFTDILQALRGLSDFLAEFEAFGFLNEDIPLINLSVNDMLSYADDFAQALDAAEGSGVATLQALEQKLKEIFNIPASSDLLDLSMVRDGDDSILRFDLSFNPAFSEALPIGFELPTAGFELSGGADLRTQGDLDLKLAFGFNLDNPTELFIFGDTGITGHIDAGAEDIAFTIGLGDPDGGAFVGGRIIEGNLGIAGDFGLTLKDSVMTGSTPDSRRILIQDLLGSLSTAVDVGMSIDVSGTLPVYFPTESLFRGNIEIGGRLSASLDDGLVVGGTVGDAGNQFIYVDPNILNFDFSQFSAMDNILLIIDGVDGFLALLQDFLDGEMAGLKMPMVGDKLGSAATFIADFREDFIDELREVVETSNDPTANFISVKLYELLHETIQLNGAGILGDRNEDGEITVDDIGLTTNIDEPGVPIRELFMQWDIQLGGNAVSAGTGIDFDLGIPGLGLETRGAVEVSVDWEVNFGFGIGGGKGFYLNLSNPDELRLDIDVTLPGGGITGTLGILQIDAADNGNTGLGASIAIDLTTTTGEDERVGITQFGNIRLNAGVAAEAHVDLGMELRLNNEFVPNAETAFPKITADFVLEWAIGDRDAGEFVSFGALGDSIQSGLKIVEFRNVGMDMGTFISNYVLPIVKEVQKITEPIQPLIDVLTTPIPVISDLSGRPTTLLDLAQQIVPPERFNVGLIRDIAGFISLVNSIPTDVDTLFIPFGGFTVYDINNPNLRGNLSSRNSNFRQGFTPTNNSSFDFNQTMSQLEAANPGASRSTSFTRSLGNQTFGQMISFPIITDPGQIFGLLMGNEVDLIRIDPAPLKFEFRYSQFFPIWGPLGAAIEGRVGVDIDFSFGYDTLGFRRFMDGGFRNPLTLFDGFYVGDWNAAGQDIPEVRFYGGITASAEINLVAAKAGVGGGIFFTVDFNLHDPDEDGKLRIYELATNFLNEFKYGEPALSPLAIFDVTGRIYAQLFAYLSVNLGFFSIDKTFNITPEIEIVKFDIPFTRIPTLATELPDGVLQLNMGKSAADRLEGNDTDIPEQFFVKQNGAGKVLV